MRVLVINCSPVRDGATAEIVRYAAGFLEEGNEVRAVCIDDYHIRLCKGCRSCHTTGRCVQRDDLPLLMEQFGWADRIVAVSPSYWADVPGQFKVFIDRCTPWSNTHEPHAAIPEGKLGYAIALRTGSGQKECEGILATLAHFYGHLGILPKGDLILCRVEGKEDVLPHEGEIRAFCGGIL